MSPLVSIVIPSYLRSDKLSECLSTIIEYTDMSQTEIIVVANGASEETKQVCEVYREFPVTLLWYPEPLGYPKAVNHGIRAARGQYIVLLNDDTVLLPQPRNEWIDVMMKPMLQDGAVGVTGPLQAFDENSGHDFLIFFCVMIRKQCFNEVGLLDESFVYFGEDTAFCIEAEKVGWKVVRVPEDHPTELKPIDPSTTTLEAWKHDKIHTGNFRIFHDAESTIGRLSDSEEVLRESRKRLRELYGTPDDVNIHRAMVTDGWIAHDELIWLARQAKACGPNATIIQIGAWHGKSSRAISDNMCEGAKLFDVDTFNGSSGEPDQHATAKEREGDHCFQWYWDNQYEQILKGEVIPMRMHSVNAAHTLNHRGVKADMIFVDGDHSADGIKADIEAWQPLLKEGGLLCGHDYYKEHEGPHWVFVRQFVENRFPNVEKSATSIWHVRPDAQRPTVIDAIPFNDELDLLEMRFSELNDVVDRFVVVEASITHSGVPKDLFFDENKQRFAPWLSKVSHIIVDDFDHVKDLQGSDKHWAIERHQRDAIMRALTECRDDDVILIGDTDEIPKAEAIKSYQTSQGLCCLEMKLYYGSMNCEGLEPWRWSRLLPYGILKQITPCGARYVPNYEEHQVIKDAGWHFSFMGGPDEWVRKLEATPHQEYNLPEFKNKKLMELRVRQGIDLLGRDIPYHLVEVDSSFPKFVLENKQRFIDNQFIYEAEMHPESFRFVEMVKNEYPQFFSGKKVLEVGSLDINGSVRQFFSDCDYEGIDLAEGKGVDRVEMAHGYSRPETFDVVISSEMLEHDKHWQKSLVQMYENLKAGGLFVLSCAGPNRPEHGTTRTDTYSSPFTTDYYRNISQEDLQEILPRTLFSECTIGYDRGGEDLHFWGVKKGGAEPAEPQIESVVLDNVIEFKPPDSLAKKKHWSVTAEVSTKDRYQTTLPMCLSAIINQTHRPDKLKVYDDGEQKNLFELSPFDGLLKLAQDKKIDVEVLSTPRKGQVTNHQHCLDCADTDFIWRVDDDEIPEPNCLETLLNTVRDYGKGGDFDKIGAVAGLVHHPANVSPLPANLSGALTDINHGNIQWHEWNSGPREVEHLYSTFMYRTDAAKKAGGYPTDLSPIGHREESIFSHSIERAGYKLLVTPHTKTHHLRESSGGIRSFNDTALWEHDEQVFQSYLKAWDVNLVDTKLIVCDFGLGDHLILKGIWPELKRRFPDRRWTLALCFPDVFKGEDATIISIADAKLLLGNRYAEFSVYKHAWDHDFVRPMPEVMLEFFSK
jgi:beta-1,4-mannosyl-glycoprotein beta-1,4-N-acetylglucosaminyltransferase